MTQRAVALSLPHAGIALGLVLSIVGMVLNRAEIIATGSNLLTVAGLFLVQRRRNGRRGDD